MSRELISQLIALYAQAVEFYEANGSEKYQVYRRRMQSFLSRPCVDDILQGKSGRMVVQREKVERHKLHAALSSKEEAQRIMEKSERRADSHRQMVREAIDSQQQQLEQRIQRRKSLSNRSANSEREAGRAKPRERMNVKMILQGIKERQSRRVFL